MFSIEIIEKKQSKKLYQWDLDRQIKITVPEGIEVDEAHFAHEHDMEALVVKVKNEDGMLVADIPNIHLQSCKPIRVWLVSEDQTVYSHLLIVIQRAKPADYVYTETEIKRIEALEKRISALEESEVFNVEYSDKSGNKTYDEITQAYEQGRLIVLNDIDNKKYYYLTSIELDIGILTFSRQEGVNHECLFLMKSNNRFTSFSYVVAKSTDVAKKQSITDETLTTTNKTIPGAINEINGRLDGAERIQKTTVDTVVQTVDKVRDASRGFFLI